MRAMHSAYLRGYGAVYPFDFDMKHYLAFWLGVSRFSLSLPLTLVQPSCCLS